MDKHEEYRISLTNEQFTIVADALEWYSRSLAGQFCVIPKPIIKYCIKNYLPYHYDEINDAADKFCKAIFGPNHKVTIGRGKNPDIPEIEIAYEMYKMMRYQLHTENPQINPHSVYSRPPLKHTNQPLIDIKTISKTEKKLEILDEI